MKEIKEIYDENVQKVKSKTPHFDICYDDGFESTTKEFEDDGFIHISNGKYRFCFYNGQGKGMLTEKLIPKFKEIVAGVLKEDKNILDMCFVRDKEYIKVVSVTQGGNLLVQSIFVPLGCNRLQDIVVSSNMHCQSIKRIKSDEYKQISLEQFKREVKKSVGQVIDSLFCM